ncbi:MAG: nucleotidyltransferase family protein [Bacteroidales bacterium]|nr:nucleotidyltransferase family protein [Bacteroidales bacterium]
MVNEAIILAGGLGTRLRGTIRDIPKAMAPVKGKPFIEYLLTYLDLSGINRVILSTGHLSSVINEHLGENFGNIHISYSEEKKPLGTGGAIALAAPMIKEDKFFVLNGDTLFKTSLKKMAHQHSETGADITIALRKMDDISRYGNISINDNNRILSFSEKENQKVEGMINAGIYLINKSVLKMAVLPDIFSIEKDLFPILLRKSNIYGYTDSAYFIDIGTPADYKKAQDEL